MTSSRVRGLWCAVGAWALSACESSPAQPDAAVDATTADVTAAPDAATDVRDAHDVSDVRSRCTDDATPGYPDASTTVRELMPVADLRFETATGAVSLRDYYAPCAQAPRLLVIRTMAAWSGPAQHAASHTQRVLSHPQADRVALLDLLVLGPDNTPAATRDLAAWRARYDVGPAALAIDPAYAFQTLYPNAGELPLYAFVDTRTMRVTHVLPRPSSADVASVITSALAAMDGVTTRPTLPEALVDGRFTRDEWEMIQAMAAPAAPPPDPTNRVADDPRAARLGDALFHDTGLSSNERVSCATCHAAETLFTDGHPHGIGVAEGGRNTPTVLLAPYARWIFWDGRVDTVWAQAIGPVENPIEMAFTRLAAAHRIADRYAAEYTALFGALPALADAAHFPARGMPGDAAWEAMRPEDRGAVDRVFVNMGKAIAAYERTLRFPTTAFDRYIAGDMSALTESQRDGLHLFFVDGCAQCHHGPTLSDDSFHNIGMPTGHLDMSPDRGRIDAIAGLESLPFRSDGAFSDDRTQGAHIARIATHPSQLGQFHTPTLRGIRHTGPWGHGGTFTTLEQVIVHYSNGLRLPPVTGTVGARDLHLPWFHLSGDVQAQLVGLMQSM